MASKKAASHYSNYLTKIAHFYRKKETKIYTNFILSFATIAFFVFFAIRPAITTIISLIKEIEDQKEVVLKLDGKLESLKEAQKEYFSLESKLGLLEEALPQDPSLSFFLGEIEALTRENDLTLSNLQTGKLTLKQAREKSGDAEGEGRVFSFGIDSSLNGKYRGIENFLESINDLRRIIAIQDFSIQKGGRAGPEILNLKLKIQAFWLPGDK
jgi:Tfp pilus assembly protein PilO